MRDSYCNGLACRKDDLKYECTACGVKICGLCKVMSVKGKDMCIACYLGDNSPDWKFMNWEFNEMLRFNGGVMQCQRQEVKSVKLG